MFSRGVKTNVTGLPALIAMLASVGLLVGTAAASVAQDAGQDKGTADAPYLHLEWEFESARGDYRNACGRVYNQREVAARHVMILFDGFDAQGKKVSSRWGEVVGDVPPGGYAIFCLQVKAGGAKYQCSISGVDWGAGGGQ
jgi:hypothetical protein